MVSSENEGISVTIPVIFLLEQTLHDIIDRVLETHQQAEKEDFLVSRGPLYLDTIPVSPQQVHEEYEEKMHGCHGGDQEKEDMEQFSRGGFYPLQTQRLIRLKVR